MKIEPADRVSAAGALNSVRRKPARDSPAGVPPWNMCSHHATISLAPARAPAGARWLASLRPAMLYPRKCSRGTSAIPVIQTSPSDCVGACGALAELNRTNAGTGKPALTADSLVQYRDRSAARLCQPLSEQVRRG
jgi:hypothetical protein